MPVRNNLGVVLDFQSDFTSLKSESMDRRNETLKGPLADDFRTIVSSLGRVSDIIVNASGGIGNNALVPWVRISNPAQSTSAQVGWYIVLLISADGSRAFLSLNQGVSGIGASQIDENRAQALASIKERGLGTDRIFDGQVLEQINLAAGTNSLASLYEKGNVFAFEYVRGSIPEDDVVRGHLAWLLERLDVLPIKNQEFDLQPLDGPDELDSFTAATHWTKAAAVRLLDSLMDESPQIILAGPPGTGKTFLAKHLAKYILQSAELQNVDDQIEVVQFHPSYGYEDFVEGLRPQPAAGGLLEFAKVPGIILRMADQIQQDGLPRVLIIDEMNRANLPRVFGELMYLLEYRDTRINLMYHGGFSLPSNLYIIGTMNTADRSIKNLDLALRRRFDFFEVPPSSGILKKFYGESLHVNELGDLLISGFDLLNQVIAGHVGDRHHGVGHSYFMKSHLTRQILTNIWDLQVFPLIEDYFFDRPHILSEFTIDRFWPAN